MTSKAFSMVGQINVFFAEVSQCVSHFLEEQAIGQMTCFISFFLFLSESVYSTTELQVVQCILYQPFFKRNFSIQLCTGEILFDSTAYLSMGDTAGRTPYLNKDKLHTVKEEFLDIVITQTEIN